MIPSPHSGSKSAIGNRQSAMALLLLALLALLRFGAFFLFLLALADNFRLSKCFSFDHRHGHRLFFHDAYGRNDSVGGVQYFNALVNLDIGNVNHIMDAKM